MASGQQTSNGKQLFSIPKITSKFGRNWLGVQTLASFGFQAFSDQIMIPYIHGNLGYSPPKATPSNK